MIGYIKYKLLQLLVRDICKRNGCDKCFSVDNTSNTPIYCYMRNAWLYEAAIKAWKLG